jgi:acetolactate synthase-1/2/3 large subunit
LARFEADGLRAPKVVLCPHENVGIHMAGGYAPNDRPRPSGAGPC